MMHPDEAVQIAILDLRRPGRHTQPAAAAPVRRTAPRPLGEREA